MRAVDGRVPGRRGLATRQRLLECTIDCRAELLDEVFSVATGWTAEIADPWGNVLGFTDYTKRPELARRA